MVVVVVAVMVMAACEGWWWLTGGCYGGEGGESEGTHLSFVLSLQPLRVLSSFLAPYPVDLTITRKVMSLSLVNFSVTDANGNVVFKVKPNKFSLRDRRSLPDAADNPILSFQKKGPVLALVRFI
ncbi:LURP-one-related 15-like protein [Tanacetum coccineum]|uniref:LURP-one-related 15-like protein n=1 Tax=Tanacetum coccineum TaxID=301880 RepID=A0ABQ5DW72_9ASTR